MLTALATAQAPLAVGQLARALGWQLPRTVAAIAAAQDNLASAARWRYGASRPKPGLSRPAGRPQPGATVTTASLPAATGGKPYSATLAAPHPFSACRARLPPVAPLQQTGLPGATLAVSLRWVAFRTACVPAPQKNAGGDAQIAAARLGQTHDALALEEPRVRAAAHFLVAAGAD